MNFLDIAPIRSVRGSVRLPGSKSISNRTLLLAALARGRTTLREVLDSDDTRYMIAALRNLGVQIDTAGERSVVVTGVGGPFPVKQADLFLGNAGTAVRPLTAVLALCEGDYGIDGVARMHERPIGDLIDALRQLGCVIDYRGNTGFPPLQISPRQAMTVPEVGVRGNVSSQFLTGLLMAVPLLNPRPSVRVDGELISKPYVTITMNAMAQFNMPVESEGWSRFRFPSDRYYESPGELFVEGDASSASYFLAAGAIAGLRGGDAVRVEGVGRHSTQGDVQFAAALERAGAAVRMGEHWIEATAAEDCRRSGHLRAIDIDCNHIPDAAMTLAITALFAEGTTTLRNIASWRVKETDRLAAMATELRKLGAVVDEGADYLRVTPPAALQSATIDTYDDHRMAMCFALAGLGGVTIRINDPDCVNKTFPAFFDVLSGISVR
jgi:3-phosphoshikimate 1-carboxyvinyltransferase